MASHGEGLEQMAGRREGPGVPGVEMVSIGAQLLQLHARRRSDGLIMSRPLTNAIPALIVGAALALSSGVALGQNAAVCTAPGSPPTYSLPDRPLPPSDVPSACQSKALPECSKYSGEISAYNKALQRYQTVLRPYNQALENWHAQVSSFQACESSHLNLPHVSTSSGAAG